MSTLAKNIRRVSSADGAVVLDVRRGTMFRLNPLGSLILELLDRGDSIQQIAEQVSAQFGVAFDAVQRDVKEFMAALEIHGVLDPHSSKAGSPTRYTP